MPTTSKLRRPRSAAPKRLYEVRVLLNDGSAQTLRYTGREASQARVSALRRDHVAVVIRVTELP